MNCAFCNRYIPAEYKFKTCDICGAKILEQSIKDLETKIFRVEKKAIDIQAELSKLLCEYEGKKARLKRLQNKSSH